MDQRHHGSSLDDLRAEEAGHEEMQGLAVMNGIVCQLTGSGLTTVHTQAAAPVAVKDPFAD
jgi:hypothetical protein